VASLYVQDLKRQVSVSLVRERRGVAVPRRARKAWRAVKLLVLDGVGPSNSRFRMHWRSQRRREGGNEMEMGPWEQNLRVVEGTLLVNSHI